jgi:hypothetical protein
MPLAANTNEAKNAPGTSIPEGLPSMGARESKTTATAASRISTKHSTILIDPTTPFLTQRRGIKFMRGRGVFWNRRLLSLTNLYAPPRHIVPGLIGAMGLQKTSERLTGGVLCRVLQMDFREFTFRGCMKSPQTRTSRLVMRRIMAAYTNDSPLAHTLS